ncbi:MAG: SDR family oxidoreductase [Bacteroidetes bacterium]|nr:SDR family oxidoreductase [Bacteroidota bacterium]
MEFSGKTVLITGGSRGIGRAISLSFASYGARVALNFRTDREAAKETIAAMEGEDHMAIKANVADPNALRKLVDTVMEEFGQIDILVNNAGIYKAHPIDDTAFAEWQSVWKETMATNLTGPANLCFLAAQHMIKQGSGRIINISSRGAFRGEPEHPAYAASKAGINALSQSLARALGKYHISVSAVAPGFVETDMTSEILASETGNSIRAQSPMGRVAKPAEVARAVLYLASEEAEFTSGAILDLNGASYLR